ncbi:MAG: 50S ribosomal protein L23 [Deltaproteobacteria bacterium]|nr:50S ribosomal protein L23 [Deltaproteobacteria bacterium]
MEMHRVIKKYLVTEKTTASKEQGNKYIFQVDRGANKIEVGRAVASLFKVKVLDVHIMNVLGKKKRVGKVVGEKSSWKKAIVTVAKDNRIEIIEGV